MNFHHIALSVRNIGDSQAFYEKLGFKEVHKWEADDKGLVIVHLKLGGVVLELFAFASNRNKAKLDLAAGNDLEELGVKHFGLQVPDVQAALDAMKQEGYQLGSSYIQHGRTKIDYFFIQDPDGMWVEIVQDNRGH